MALAGLLGLIFGCCCKKENEVEDFEKGGSDVEEGDTNNDESKEDKNDNIDEDLTKENEEDATNAVP